MGPFIRTVGTARVLSTKSTDQLRALLTSMQARPMDYLPSYVRAVAAEIKRRTGESK